MFYGKYTVYAYHIRILIKDEINESSVYVFSNNFKEKEKGNLDF